VQKRSFGGKSFAFALPPLFKIFQKGLRLFVWMHSYQFRCKFLFLDEEDSFIFKKIRDLASKK